MQIMIFRNYFENKKYIVLTIYAATNQPVRYNSIAIFAREAALQLFLVGLLLNQNCGESFKEMISSFKGL